MQKFTEREHVTLIGVKNWFIAVLLFLLALPSAAYSQKLRVGTLYIGSTMLPLWIAREEGYFPSSGFEVELIWLQSTLSTMALIAGEVDLIYAPRNASGHDRQERSSINHRRIVETNSKHWLVVSPSIQSVKDLVGKTLATSRPKTADEGYARIILRRCRAARALV